MREHTLHVFQQQSHILSLWGSSEIIDVRSKQLPR